MADDQTQLQDQSQSQPEQTTESITPAKTPPQPTEQATSQESPQPEENTQTPTAENPQPTQNPEPPTQSTTSSVETPSSEIETNPQANTNPPTSEPKPEEPKENPPAVSVPQLHYPFIGDQPITFSFGAQSDNEEIKKKFSEWGITGHNGLDFGLTEGTEIYPCDNGKVIQSGENGDFGNSINLEHSWGTSLYAHLKEVRVNVGDDAEINKVIGLSGKTGAAFGEHLHFAIKSTNSHPNNGYLGFIDPSPYLSLPSQKEETPPAVEPKQETETPPVQTPPTEEQRPSEQPLQETKPPETPQPVQEQPEPEEVQPQDEVIPPPIKLEPEKPVEQPENTKLPEQPQQPETSLTPEVPQPSPEEIQQQVDEKLKTELDLRRQKANQTRQAKREENLMKIEKLIGERKQVNNDDVRELLHVSQSTATEYLQDLVKRGTLKTEGKGKATVYHY